MELPLYPFTEFVRDHAEHAHTQDRPLRSTVSAYYKAYVDKVGIAANFSSFTTITAVYHLKDLERHCCCTMDPLRSSASVSEHLPSQQTGTCRLCAPYRYAILGHTERHPTLTRTERPTHGHRKRTRFLIRCKTLILATGTFDQPKKLQAVGPHPCTPPCVPTAIQQTFHDTKQLEEWIKRHDQLSPALQNNPAPGDNEAQPSTVVSPPPSPLPTLDASPSIPRTIEPKVGLAASYSTHSSLLPIVIVGTGLSAADAILLIQEKQPWRRVLHIYRHFTASEPSPLKRCHRDVYPEYASVWQKMRKFASLRKAIQPYQPYDNSYAHVANPTAGDTADTSGGSTANECKACIALQMDLEQLEVATISSAAAAAALCADCSYRGLPDAAISSWNPLTGEISILMNHGVMVKDRVAAVGVFIGKEVHMAFLKGSLAQEMLSSEASSPGVGDARYGVGGLATGASSGTSGTNCSPGETSGHGVGNATDHTGRTGDARSVRGKTGGTPFARRGSDPSHVQRLEMLEMVTPPCTPPRSPVLKPRQQLLWKKRAIKTAASNVAAATEELLKNEKELLDLSSTESRYQHGNEAVDVNMDIDDQSLPLLDKKSDQLHPGVRSPDEIKTDDIGDQSGSDTDSAMSEEEKLEKYQVLTLLHPLVSDMYSFRIIPTNATPISSSTLPYVSPASTAKVSQTGTVNDANLGLGAEATIAQDQGKTMPAMTIPATAYYAPTRAKRCTRLPRYPKRSFEDESLSRQDENSNNRERFALSQDSTSDLPSSYHTPEPDHSMGPEQAMGRDTRRVLDVEGIVSSESLPRVHSGTPGSNSVRSVTRALSSCISMPCSPLLGCRIVCPALPPPPPLMLGASAPSVNMFGDSTVVISSAMAFSTSAPSRPTMDMSTLSPPSPTFSSSVSLSSSNCPSPAMSLTSANSSTTSLALDAIETSAGVLGFGESDMEEKRTLDEGWCCDCCTSECQCHSSGGVMDMEKEIQAPCEPEPKLMMDQSIYAAGAITGSKFVRYVLGNGMAIVADILKNERSD
ncbi:hypothetical protein BGW38_010781 [Lunasporangiospora selenospora]|uniref:Uncharacterized protein n=1 Tax=Lunasporangiospora selenospora TaxID=979761 RepID=A0A9P6FW23_9FUNG|nr:hypothetical protein BGW38_010781 [Lunasporangiospora selenospora]